MLELWQPKLCRENSLQYEEMQVAKAKRRQESERALCGGTRDDY